MEKMSWRVWVGGWEGGGDEVQQVLNEGLSSRTERKVVNKNELLGNRSQNLTRDPSSISGKLRYPSRHRASMLSVTWRLDKRA